MHDDGPPLLLAGSFLGLGVATDLVWGAGRYIRGKGRHDCVVDGENVRACLPKNVACDVAYNTTEPIFEVALPGLSLCFYLAPRAGFEPATNRLTAGCSTAELPGNG